MTSFLFLNILDAKDTILEKLPLFNLTQRNVVTILAIKPEVLVVKDNILVAISSPV